MSEKRLNALQEALKREEEGKAFYQDALGKSSNKMGKEMFDFLVRAEDAHIRKIKQLYATLEKEGTWPNIIPNREEIAAGKDVCAAVRGTMTGEMKASADDIAALRRALQMEDEGIKYYQCQAEGTDDLFEKKFYLLLVNEETDHWLSILDSLEFLEDPEGYFHQQEMTKSMFM